MTLSLHGCVIMTSNLNHAKQNSLFLPFLNANYIFYLDTPWCSLFIFGKYQFHFSGCSGLQTKFLTPVSYYFIDPPIMAGGSTFRYIWNVFYNLL